MSLLLIEATYWTVPHVGSINLIDFLWMLVGAASVATVLFNLVPIFQDWANAPAGALRVVAHGYLRRELVRLVQALSILGIGIYACLVSPPTSFGGKDIITPVGVAVTAVLFIIGTGVGLQSFLDRRLRGQLIDYIEQHDDALRESGREPKHPL